MQKILVCDIDNTVADQLSRLKRHQDSQTRLLNLDAAYSAKEILKDNLIAGSLEGVIHFSNLGYKVIWLTARKAILREATDLWLRTNGFPVDELILVDRLSDKVEVIKRLNPTLVIDDCLYNLAHLDPKEATDFIESIKNIGVTLEIFQNNWDSIRAKYST